MRKVYRLLSLVGTFKAARRGPSSLGRRQGRRVANRHFNRWLRKALKP